MLETLNKKIWIFEFKEKSISLRDNCKNCSFAAVHFNTIIVIIIIFYIPIK